MTWLKQLFSRRRRYDDLAVSIQEHIDERAEELIDEGMSREVAAQTARREFGNVTLIHERSREAWQWPTIESLLSDIRYSLRKLRKSPGFAAAVILTMALGIGATTGIFALVDATLLQSLPYPEASRIIHITDQRLQGQSPAGLVAVPRFFDLRARSRSFESLAFFYFDHTTLIAGTHSPVALRTVGASGQFWQVYGVRPLLGRTFDERDDQPNAPDTAVLSYSAWQQLFGSDPGIIGRQVQLDQLPATIIGVMPKTFNAPMGVALWRPAHFAPEDWKYRTGGARFLNIFARLKPGVSLAMAQQDLRRVGIQLQKEYPATDGEWQFGAESLRDNLYGDLRPALLVLLSASALLLLIACINVANLLLSRAASREHEVALRRALGASNSRIALQFLIESTMLSLIGGCIGLCAAWALIHTAAAKLPGRLGAPGVAVVHWPIVWFAFLLSVLAGIIFGIAPAWLGRRRELNLALKHNESRLTGTASAGRAQNTFISVQVGLSMMLTIGAALLAGSLWNLMKSPLGFHADHRLTFSINLPWNAKPSGIRNFYADVQQKIEALPGVTAVGQIDALPTTDWHLRSSFDADWLPRIVDHPQINAEDRHIAGNYLQAMGIPLLAGRTLSEQDALSTPLRVLVNQKLDQEYIPGANPIGRHLFIGNESLEIVGIVANVRGTAGSISRAVGPEVYFPADGDRPVSLRSFVVESRLPPEQLIQAIRAQVQKVDPQQAIGNISTMDDLVDKNVAQPRLNLALVAFFAASALLLACIGIYGVVAYSVAQRTREIGVRMALGATRAQISQFFLRNALFAAGFGITGGGIASFMLSRFLRSQLYGVNTDNLSLYIASAVLLLLPVLLAALLPARRAASVDPVEALRAE